MVGYLCRYVMDELGSAMRHSDIPNFRIAPFLFMPEGKLASAIRYCTLKISFSVT
jgi:tubulin--tyrosine ligase-like protein 12